MASLTDLDRTLQDLEGHDWGEPTYDSYLVTTCHRLRRVPLRHFTLEDLRVMISQSIGLDFLVPIALDRLALDPLAEGDFYPGDLLVSVVSVPPAYWVGVPDLHAQARDVAERAMKLVCDPAFGTDPFTERFIGDALRPLLVRTLRAFLTRTGGSS